MRDSVGLIARFGLAGLVNTGVGLAVVVVLDPVLGVSPAWANAIGYAVGMTVGFILNHGFVFRSQSGMQASGPRYLLAAVAAFALNQGVLRLAGLALGAGAIAHLAAQLLAMGAYSVALFVICRLWVFRTASPSTPA